MKALRLYVIVWGLANSLILTSNLIFFRLHHIGDASWVFISCLVSAAFIFGGLFGALNWAVQTLLIDIERVSQRYEQTRKLLSQMSFGLSGFIVLGLLNGIFSNGSLLQVLFLATAVLSASHATGSLRRSGMDS